MAVDHQRRNERGATIVESALILIMFFMLLFGVMEAGRFLYMRQVLTNAAREGARYAVLPLHAGNTLPDLSAVQTKVSTYLDASKVTGATTTTTCPTTATETCSSTSASMSIVTGSVTTEYTEVAVSKTYSVITIPGFFKTLNITLTGKSRMRRETSD